jgi:hypothetical protein
MQPTISGLIDAVRQGDLALPEFQRDYRWPPSYIEELLRSVARGWPIGTLLLLDQTDNPKGLTLKPRSIEKGPPCKKRPDHLILDGQQRITALFHAMNGLGDSVFFVNLETLMGAGEFIDECLASVRATQVERRLGRDETRRKKRIILLRELYSTELFFDWISYLPKKERKRYTALRDEHLALFREHTVTLERLSNGLPVEAIAKIFERTNRGFLRLDAFDLMVAIMYPHKFKLRDKWEAAQLAHPILQRFNIAPIEILRLIALREHLSQKAARKSPQTVKGVRQSDVLEVKPQVVKREWVATTKAYARALALVASHWGVTTPRVMPAEAQLLPLADALYGGNIRSGSTKYKKLTRWFWAAIFSRQYARAANTRAVSDAEALRRWLKSGGAEPRYVKEFTVTAEDFSLVEDGNEILVRGLCCLLNTTGARNWARAATDKLPDLMTDLDTEMAVHHVFPKKFMERKSKSALRQLPHIDVPANQVLIPASLNSKLLNEAPEHTAKNPDVDLRGMETHHVEPQRMKGSGFKQFVSARSASLVPIVDRAVKGY